MRLLFTDVLHRARKTSTNSKMSWVIESVMDEMLDTLAEADNDEELARYLELTAQVMHWVATGEDADMPDEFRNRLELTAEKETLALPAGEAMIAH